MYSSLFITALRGYPDFEAWSVETTVSGGNNALNFLASCEHITCLKPILKFKCTIYNQHEMKCRTINSWYNNWTEIAHNFISGLTDLESEFDNGEP